jgi:hypothetical protein
VTSLAACGDFTDAPPDPSVAPLEIVANNPAAARCSLNRTEVGVGTHEVVVITEGVDAVVTVRDASGAVLLEQHGDTWPQAPAGDGSAEQGPAEGSTTGSAQLSLSAGTYDVTCRYPDGAEGSTSLRVTR